MADEDVEQQQPEQPVSSEEEAALTTQLLGPPPPGPAAVPAAGLPAAQPLAPGQGPTTFGTAPYHLEAPRRPDESAQQYAFRLALERAQARDAPQQSFQDALAKAEAQRNSWWAVPGKVYNTFGGTFESAFTDTYAATMRAIGSGLGAIEGQFDSAKRYQQQSVPQLLDGIGEANDRIKELIANKGSNSSEYIFAKRQNEILMLQDDIAAMHRALSAKSGAPQPGPIQGFFQERARAAEQFLAEERGEVPYEKSNLERFLSFGSTSNYPRDVQFEQSPGGIVTQAGANLLALAGTGGVSAATRVPRAAIEFGMIGGQAFESNYKQLKDEGKTDEQATLGAWLSLPGAAAQMAVYHYLLGGASTGAKTWGQVRDRLFRNIIAFPATGAAAQVGTNLLIAGAGVDPERRWDAGVQEQIESGVAFALMGAAVHDAPSAYLKGLKKPDLDPYKADPTRPTPNVRTTQEGGTTPPIGPVQTDPVEHSSAVGTGAAEREAVAAQAERDLAQTQVTVPAETMLDQIRKRAYEISQERAREGRPGDAQSDWNQAQREYVEREAAEAKAGEGELPRRLELGVAGTELEQPLVLREAIQRTGGNMTPSLYINDYGEGRRVDWAELPGGMAIERNDGKIFIAPSHTMAAIVADIEGPNRVPGLRAVSGGQVVAGVYYPFSRQERFRGTGLQTAIVDLNRAQPLNEQNFGYSSVLPSYLKRVPITEPTGEVRARADAANTGAVSAAERSAPLTPGLLRSVMKGLIRAIGPRADFAIVNARSLPKRYDAALAAHGLNRNTFKAFYDRATGDFYVNPDNFNDVNEFYDAVIRKFLGNTFRPYADVAPISSWKDWYNNPDVARALNRDPDMDMSTSAAWSPSARMAFINVPKLLRTANPVREAVRSIVHEVSIHGGLHQLFPDLQAYNDFLDRMYERLDRSGVGNTIASDFGTTMEGLARKYGYGRDVEGEWIMDKGQRRRLAEELLARYSERFDPQQLDKLPNVLNRMLDLVQTGLDRWHGIELSRAELFKAVQDAWKANEPPRIAEAKAALAVRRMQKANDNEDTNSELRRRADTDTAQLEAHAGRSEFGGVIPANDGRPASAQDIRSSSRRLSDASAAQGTQYDAERLAAAAPIPAAGQPGDTHDIRLSPGTGRAWKITRIDSQSGPYGAAPASERAAALTEGRLARAAAQGAQPVAAQAAPAAAAGAGPAAAGAAPASVLARPAAAGAVALPGEPGRVGPGGATERYDTGSATAGQYLARLNLSNRIFGTGNRLEGTLPDPASGLTRIITTQPQHGTDTTHEPTYADIAGYMAARGFEQVDSDTYYDPRRRVLVMEANPDTIRADNNTGALHMIDVNPQEVSGELARELDERVAAHDWTQAVEEPEEIANLLAHHGLGGPAPAEAEAMTRALEAQAQADRREVEQIRTVQATRPLTLEEQFRLDQLEMGPMLEKDISDEMDGPLEPGSAPMKLLQTAYESQTMAKGIRRHGERMANDPLAPDAVKLFNASPSQIEYDRISKEGWTTATNRFWQENGGDSARVFGDFINGAYHTVDESQSMEIPIYTRLLDEVRARRTEALARGDAITAGQMEDAEMRMNQYLVKNITGIAKTMAAWKIFQTSREGMDATVRGQYQDYVEERVNRDRTGNWSATRDGVMDVAGRVQNDAINDPAAGRIIDAAQDAHNRQPGQGARRRRFRLEGERVPPPGEPGAPAERAPEEPPRPLGERIADTLTNEFARAIGVATRKASLSPEDAQVVALANAVKAKIREQLPAIVEETRGGPPEEKVTPSPTDTIRGLLNRWADFESLFNQATESMRHGMDPGRLGVFLQQLKTQLDMPLTQRQLNKFLSEQQTSIRDLVVGHWTYRNNTMDSLRDVLLEGTNLTPEQAQTVDDALRKVLASKITEQTEREFQRLIDQTEGGTATEANKLKARQRLMELVNMGAFSSNQVADALGILYGFDKSYLPSILNALQPLIDQFEKYKAENRTGRQTQAIRFQISRALAEHARLGFWEYWNNVLVGNLISGIPSHIAALMSEMFKGSLNAIPMYYNTLRLARQQEGAVVSPEDANRLFVDSLKALKNGFWNALAPAGQTLATGVSGKYTRFQDVLALGGPELMAVNPFEARATERFLGRTPGVGTPFGYIGRGVDVSLRTVFRAIDALHSLVSGTFGNATEHMLTVRFYVDHGMPFNEAVAAAREAMYNPGGKRAAIEQQVAREADIDGYDPNSWRGDMRRNELIDQAFPQPIRDEAAYWASEANFFHKPYGILGLMDNAMSAARTPAPQVRQLFPIWRIAMNLIDQSLDVSPFGLLRYYSTDPRSPFPNYLEVGRRIETQAETQARVARGEAVPRDVIPYDRYEELRGQLLFRGILGTSVFALASQLPHLVPGLQINGYGPHDRDMRSEWLARGGKSWSLQFGDHYFSYENLPIYGVMGAIGNYYDARRWGGADPVNAFTASATGVMTQILDRTVLTGLKDLVDTEEELTRAKPGNEAQILGNYVASQAATRVPVLGSIFLKNLGQAIDNRLFEKKGLGAAARAMPLPLAPLNVAKPQVNIFGEDVRLNNPYFNRFWSGGDSHTPADHVFDFMLAHNIAMGNPTKENLMGKPMDHDQLYDYSILKGQAFLRLVYPRLAELGTITDRAVLGKEWKKIEALARREAVGRMLSGEHGIAQ